MILKPRHMIEVEPEIVSGKYTELGNRVQDVMRHPDVVELVTLDWAPSIFKDPNYTDLMVVWDCGEGPHNPEAFDSDDWRKNRCLPQVVWELVKQVVNSVNIVDERCAVWLRSDESVDITGTYRQ